MPVSTKHSAVSEGVWALLARALDETLLPGEDGRLIRCTISDFMLKTVDGEGVARFKNRATRNYLHVRPDGTAHIPMAGAWNCGFFATMLEASHGGKG